MNADMTSFPTPTSLVEAEALDRADPLAFARDRFVLPQGLIYLDGHSLGPASRASLDRVETAAGRDWALGLIRSWNDAGWIDLPRRLGARLARLVGAEPDEVVVCDAVSANIFKLAAAALPLVRAPRLIVETDEFPTDAYVLEGLARLARAELVRVAPGEGPAALAAGGVLVKSVVNYRTARVADIAAHEAAAVAGGGRVVWDLSHATGVLALDLPSAGAALATGCTYKYLNGGPGAPAFVYVARELAGRLASPLSGWFGHARPFDFDGAYEPAPGAARFAAGTPPILSLAALDGALDAFDGVDLAAVQAKARALGDLVLARAAALGLPSISPEAGRRGGHVSLLHADGYAIVQALIARGVIGDFRAPDAMRFGFGPLYVGYADVWRAMDALQDVIETRAFDDPRFRARAAVT